MIKSESTRERAVGESGCWSRPVSFKRKERTALGSISPWLGCWPAHRRIAVLIPG